MLKHFGKCKCLHVRHENMNEDYNMGDAVLGRTTQEQDIRVIFSADMKVSRQRGIASSKGNQILGLITKLSHVVQCLPKKILVHYQLLMLNFRRLNLTI